MDWCTRISGALLAGAAALALASGPASAAVRAGGSSSTGAGGSGPAVGGSGPAVGGSGPGSGSGLPAQLTGFACARALDPANRAISVQAVMRPVAGTRAMAIQVALLEQPTGARAMLPVRSGDLGRWISPSEAGLGQRPGDVWRLDKAVVNLEAPAVYRFRVSFRWTGTRGRVIGRATRVSGLCRQRELRPDLLVRSLTAAPIAGDPSHDSYTAVIADRGASAAGPFEVLFAPGDGSAPQVREITRLGAGSSRQLEFTGPLCDPSAPPTVTVDAARQVDDLDRSNNAAGAVCPAPAAAGSPQGA